MSHGTGHRASVNTPTDQPITTLPKLDSEVDVNQDGTIGAPEPAPEPEPEPART